MKNVFRNWNRGACIAATAVIIILGIFSDVGAFAQSGSTPGSLTKIVEGVIDPALGTIEGLGSVAGIAELIDGDDKSMRDLWAKIEAEAVSLFAIRDPAIQAAMSRSMSGRGTHINQLQVRLIDAVTAKLRSLYPDEDSARLKATKVVKAAQQFHYDRRRAGLLNQVRCKCVKEEWTRTLSACFEDCANGQKAWIEEWMQAGLSDEEVRAAMLGRVDNPKVIVLEKNKAPMVFAYAIFAFAALGGIWALLSVRVRRKSAAAAVSDGSAEKAIDSELEAELERELREMDEE